MLFGWYPCILQQKFVRSTLFYEGSDTYYHVLDGNCLVKVVFPSLSFEHPYVANIDVVL